MNMQFRWLAGIALIFWASFAQAEFHLFVLDQFYSNADGSVQFVVLRESTGSNNEHLWAGRASLRATPAGGAAQVLPFTTNLPSAATANRRVLVATPGFAALGIVTPDYMMPANFLPTGAGQVNYAGVDTINYTALPTDGVNALSRSGAIVHNVATNFAGASASVVPAVIPTAVAVEFYHAGFDHYFITHLVPEIAILDAGVTIRGWTRTNQTFNVYAAAGPGTSPVCRFRIPPESGDSHFYGRGTTECDETAAKFPTFINEDPAFFHVVLPVLGVCPAGTIPVHRAFSNRPGDANHRYMIVRALLDVMVSQHWEPEGDGDYVAMCVPATASVAPAPVAPPAPPPPPPMPEPPDPPYYPGYP